MWVICPSEVVIFISSKHFAILLLIKNETFAFYRIYIDTKFQVFSRKHFCFRNMLTILDKNLFRKLILFYTPLNLNERKFLHWDRNFYYTIQSGNIRRFTGHIINFHKISNWIVYTFMLYSIIISKSIIDYVIVPFLIDVL